MKKFTFILVIAFLTQTGTLFAQDIETVTFNAILEEVLNLNITGGTNTQTATFASPDNYNLGIDAVGTTTITVESTTDWYLDISAPDLVGGTGGDIPINNVGVWVANTGAHQIGPGLECTSAFTSLATSCGITNAVQTIIDNGTGNAGDASDNAFNVNWTMGTMNNTMNGLSIFDQLANGDFTTGTYVTTVSLTLTAL